MAIQELLPEDAFLHIYEKIFHNLATEDLFNAGLTCTGWKRISDDIYERKSNLFYIYIVAFKKCLHEILNKI